MGGVLYRTLPFLYRNNRLLYKTLHFLYRNCRLLYRTTDSYKMILEIFIETSHCYIKNGWYLVVFTLYYFSNMPPKKKIADAKSEFEKHLDMIRNFIAINGFKACDLDDYFLSITPLNENKKEMKAIASKRLQEIEDEEEEMKREIAAYFENPLTPREEKRYIVSLQKAVSPSFEADTGNKCNYLSATNF